MNSLDETIRENQVPIGDIGFLAHGTTVATNTLIEGKQAKVGLLTSEGFSDVLEIAYQTRPDLFDLLYDKPTPLVPRYLTAGVPERIGAEGEIFVELDEAVVAKEAQRLSDAGSRRLSSASCTLTVSPLMSAVQVKSSPRFVQT